MSTRPLGGVATGIALVVLAVLVGRIADGTPAPTTAAAEITPTGRTTTVAVSISGMRYRPATITVPAGDRLVLTLTNHDERRHDLVLATGPRSGGIAAHATATLDAGVIGGEVAGWCSLPGHRQSGMTLRITASGPGSGPAGANGGTSASGIVPPAGGGQSAPDTHGEAHDGDPAAGSGGGPALFDPMATPGPDFTPRNPAAPAAGTARTTHRLDLHVREAIIEVSPGVRQKLWTYNGTVPGPVLRGRVGDTFEIRLVNDGGVDHGVDFHAGALAPDGPMRPIEPGQSLTYRFTAARAGIWMYHCSTAPMLLHIGNGMYGAVIIDPPALPRVDREYVLVQSELYLGAQDQPGDLARMRAERPDAVVFNGYANQYATHPLTARPGERVRVWVLDAGPNRPSSFHVVGGQFDTVYAEGRYQLRPGDPGAAQVLDLAPAAGGFVETVLPEPGHYPFVTHAMVDAERGARGVIAVR